MSEIVAAMFRRNSFISPFVPLFVLFTRLPVVG